MDKYTNALVLEISYAQCSCIRDSSITFFDPFGRHFYKQIFTIFWNSQNPQNLTSKVYFLYAIQNNTELLSKTIQFVT